MGEEWEEPIGVPPDNRRVTGATAPACEHKDELVDPTRFILMCIIVFLMMMNFYECCCK